LRVLPRAEASAPEIQFNMQPEGANMSFIPGLRFRKSWSILPGVKVNLSKTGVSTSLGGRGATVNVGTRSRSATIGLPGTGLSYRKPLTGSIVVLIAIAVALLVVAWLIRPDLVLMLLHAWQPRLF
jgi:hypothetical protein